MKKIFLFAFAIVIFACSSSFASKKGEFTFGIDKVLGFCLKNKITYVDGKTKIYDKYIDNVITINSPMKFNSEVIIQNLEYCLLCAWTTKRAKTGNRRRSK